MIGAIFNSFYDLDLLERSAAQLRQIIKHIVVVHQPISFYGEVGDPKNIDHLLEMKKTGIIDKLILSDTHITSNHSEVNDYVIDKRNLGLDSCILNRCEYIVSLDNDEFYDPIELLGEVKYMKMDNIDTLYSPIDSYYHGDQYYFQDTFFVPSVYKVDERRFIKTSSVYPTDPARRMLEKKFRLSKMRMRHLTYGDSFIKKGLSNSRNLKHKDKYLKVVEHYKNWKPGDKALVFISTKGLPELKLVDLSKRI